MLSVIVPVHNQVHFTKSLIDTFTKRIKGDWELIIVSNGSVDETAFYLSKIKHKRIKTFSTEKRMGFARACNKGYELSTGDNILFLNNDVEIYDQIVEKIEAYLKDNPKHIVGPQLVKNNSLVSYKGMIFSYINGWCLAMTREAAQDIFNDNYGEVFSSHFPHFFEDAYLCQQAKFLGYQLREINIDIRHLVSQSSAEIDSYTMTKVGQQVFRQKIIRLRARKKTKTVVFYCAGVPYGFTPDDYDGKGVGGAEAALMQLAKQLAKTYHVEVYNRTNTEGIYDGVHYYNISSYLDDYKDVFILFRSYTSELYTTPASRKIFWSCDQKTDEPVIWEKLIFPEVNDIVAISEYHKKYLMDHYKVDKEKISIIPLSTRSQDYSKPIPKLLGKTIYCSVPGRGLERLARIAPLIKKEVPEFTLTITSDYRLWGLDTPDNASYKDLFGEMKYVHFVGKVDRASLVHHQLESNFMLYPCTYEECFCISALECMYAGATPIVTNIGALGETVGKGGIVLSNRITDEDYANIVIKQFKKPRAVFSKERASEFTWDNISQVWLEIINKEGVMPTKKTVKENDKPVKKMAAPESVKMSFKQEIEVQINGRKYVGHEMRVPIDVAPAISQIVREAYGDIEK